MSAPNRDDPPAVGRNRGALESTARERRSPASADPRASATYVPEPRRATA
jgi:hypothetical protein